MALTDSNPTLPLAVPAAAAYSRQALARLPQIHAETSDTAGLARFLDSAAMAAALLLLLAILALIVAGNAGLQQEFSWSLLMLAGVGAMLRSYIKSTAQAFDRTPLRAAAKDLRAVLFYAGFAWGAGAFMLLGNDPVPIVGLCYAALPSVLLPLLVKDRIAGLSFLAPVTVLSAAAIILEPWGSAPVALVMLLVVQGSIAIGLALPGRSRGTMLAGLSLR
jgi:hypothetical protein